MIDLPDLNINFSDEPLQRSILIYLENPSLVVSSRMQWRVLVDGKSEVMEDSQEIEKKYQAGAILASIKNKFFVDFLEMAKIEIMSQGKTIIRPIERSNISSSPLASREPYSLKSAFQHLVKETENSIYRNQVMISKPEFLNSIERDLFSISSQRILESLEMAASKSKQLKGPFAEKNKELSSQLEKRLLDALEISDTFQQLKTCFEIYVDHEESIVKMKDENKLLCNNLFYLTFEYICLNQNINLLKFYLNGQVNPAITLYKAAQVPEIEHFQQKLFSHFIWRNFTLGMTDVKQREEKKAKEVKNLAVFEILVDNESQVFKYSSNDFALLPHSVFELEGVENIGDVWFIKARLVDMKSIVLASKGGSMQSAIKVGIKALKFDFQWDSSNSFDNIPNFVSYLPEHNFTLSLAKMQSYESVNLGDYTVNLDACVQFKTNDPLRVRRIEVIADSTNTNNSEDLYSSFYSSLIEAGVDQFYSGILIYYYILVCKKTPISERLNKFKHLAYNGAEALLGESDQSVGKLKVLIDNRNQNNIEVLAGLTLVLLEKEVYNTLQSIVLNQELRHLSKVAPIAILVNLLLNEFENFPFTGEVYVKVSVEMKAKKNEWIIVEGITLASRNRMDVEQFNGRTLRVGVYKNGVELKFCGIEHWVYLKAGTLVEVIETDF